MSDEDRSGLDVNLMDFETLTIFETQLSPELIWSWHDVITRWGLDQALDMITKSAAVIKGEVTDTEREHMRRWLRAIKRHGDLSGDKEDWALRMSYNMLSLREWTRSEALRLARTLIDPNMTADGWRRRVDRWAKRKGKPRIGLTRGRPRGRKE